MTIDLNKIEPHAYDKDLKQLNNNFYLVLGELEKSYIQHKSNQANQQYEKIYKNNMNNLSNVFKDAFLTKTSLESQKDIINENSENINDTITDIEDINERLKIKINNLEGSKNTASGNIYDKQYLYNSKLFDIFVLAFCTVGAGILLYKKKL